MKTQPRKSSFAVLAVFLLLGANPLTAAAPRLVLVSGEPLSSPVVLSDWEENLRLMTAMKAVGPPMSELVGRSYLRLSLFWGQEWNRYVEAGKPIDSLRPEDATQQDRFYPACRDLKPAVTLERWGATSPALGGGMTAEGLDILERHRIPTRIEGPPGK